MKMARMLGFSFLAAFCWKVVSNYAPGIMCEFPSIKLNTLQANVIFQVGLAHWLDVCFYASVLKFE